MWKSEVKSVGFITQVTTRIKILSVKFKINYKVKARADKMSSSKGNAEICFFHEIIATRLSRIAIINNRFTKTDSEYWLTIGLSLLTEKKSSDTWGLL